PVAPINVILTASYLAVLFNFSPGHTIDPVGTTWGTPIGITIVAVCFLLLLAIFIPAYLGIRLGAAFATVLGVLSMLPITAMIFLPFFKPGSLHWGNVAGFQTPPGVHVSPAFIAAWFFPILWNVIAMEAAACYVGECRGGARDAKIALTAEGIFGMSLTTADPLTLYLSYTDKIFGHSSWERWFIGIPLVLALGLSVLNAIMGCGRSLYQAAEDGLLPKWFEHKNKHGVPHYAMGFNVACSALLVLLGSPVRIYIISNAGYLLSCTLAFGGYFVYRHLRPDVERPFRLPTFAKWGALGVFAIWTVIYFYGGWNSPNIVIGPGQGPGLYLLGLLIVTLYAPLYWWRARQDRRSPAVGLPAVEFAGAAEPSAPLTGEPAGELSGEPPAAQ